MVILFLLRLSINFGFCKAVYNKMMRERPIFYRRVLEAGYNFLFVDADIVVLKNPLPYLRYIENRKILF